MEAIAVNRDLPHLYRKIESLPFKMQEDVLFFTNFLLNKSKAKSDENFDIDDHHFSGLSMLSLSREWDSSEDEEWDTILSQMPSVP